MIIEEAIRQIKEFIQSLPEDCFTPILKENLPDKDAPVPNIYGWEAKVDIKGEWIDIIITLTRHFPNKVPRIYYKDVPFPIPHLTPSRDNHLCTVDHPSTFLDIDYPILIFHETIEIAAQLIKDGINKQNTKDFIKEFRSYWIIGGGIPTWLSIIKPDPYFKIIKIIEFAPGLNRINWIAAENEHQGISWLSNIDREVEVVEGRKRSVQKIYNGIYLHFLEPIYPPYPENNFELYQILKRKMLPEELDKFCLFLFKNNVESVPVIFSFVYPSTTNDKMIFGGFILKRPKICKSENALLPGFRNSKIPPVLQFTNAFADSRILKSNVLRIDNERLQQRIGDSKMTVMEDRKIVLIGCGSIGCRIAVNCALAGIGRIILIDDDKLEAENIKRHICNMKDIGLHKVDAVTKYIKKRMPHIDVIPIKDNGYDLLTNKKEIFLESDIVISATGDKTFNVFMNGLSLPIPILYSWIEINGYASHSIIIHPEKGGCLNCTYDDFKNERHNCIISEAEVILQQEAGCNTIYLPFSAIASDSAAGFATRCCLMFLNNNVQMSEYWIYYGDLNDAENKNLKLSVAVEKSYSLHKETIARKLNCNSCERKA